MRVKGQQGQQGQQRRWAYGLCVGALCISMLAGCGKSQPAEITAHGKPLSHWLAAGQSPPDATARKQAARILGNVGAVDPGIEPALTLATKDKALQVRQEAAAALQKMRKSK